MRTLHRTNHEYTPKCFCNVMGADDAAMAAAAIGAAGSVAGATINGISAGNLNKKNRKWQEEQQKKQMEWNEKMWNQTNDWNLAQWERQNEYNTPTAQLARLRDAGLNPLYYGLDGSAAGDLSASQPLGYEQAKLPNQVNPFGEGIEAMGRLAQVTSLMLDNKLKEKDIEWYDREHGAELDFKSASIEEVRMKVQEAEHRIQNLDADTRLKDMNCSKAEAETAVEWAKYASIGLDNALKEQLNPLIVEAQELANKVAKVRSEYEEKRILAELAEKRAHIAALYAQAALDGARKEGVDLDNKIKEPEVKFAGSNARWRANAIKWTAESAGENLKQERYNTKNARYYSEHYEEAFRNSWSQSGVEWGVTENVGQAIGNAAMLGMMLAF